MTDDKIRQVVEMYRARLDAQAIKPRRLDGEVRAVELAALTQINESILLDRMQWSNMRLLAHCRFMCDEILSLVEQGRREKVMRWFGWLQCALWAAGVVPTLADGARDSMPDPDEEFRAMEHGVKP